MASYCPAVKPSDWLEPEPDMEWRRAQRSESGYERKLVVIDEALTKALVGARAGTGRSSPEQTLVEKVDGWEKDIRALIDESNAALEPGAVHVDESTTKAAIEFARMLPSYVPVPELTAEADGEISFDWLGPHGRIFSVSLNSLGRIAYAGKFGEKSKVHGIEELSATCPPEIVWGIEKTIS